MPTGYTLAWLAFVIGGLLGSYISTLLFKRWTKLPPDLAAFVGLSVWFMLSSFGVWLRFTQIDDALAVEHRQNVGVWVVFIAIWIALSLFGTLLGGILAGLTGGRR